MKRSNFDNFDHHSELFGIMAELFQTLCQIEFAAGKFHLLLPLFRRFVLQLTFSYAKLFYSGIFFFAVIVLNRIIHKKLVLSRQMN